MATEYSNRQGDALSNIGIVLDRTRHAANIGAVCRILKNLGFGRLHLVSPTEFAHTSAIRMMRGSEDMMENAEIADSLQTAVADYHITFATSHRMRQDEAMGLRQAAMKIAKLSKKHKVAIIFGSEKHGLAKEDVLRADYVVRLPVDENFPSINLAQAVAVTAMQIKLELEEEKQQETKPQLQLTKGELQPFMQSLFNLMDECDLKQPSAQRKAKAVFERANLSRSELNLFAGLIKAAKKKVS